jgi:membrane protein implicated in regulation of membrane protease activity
MSGLTGPGFGVAGVVIGVEATGELPFTGFAVGVFFLIGLALVLSGLIVRFVGARKG